MYALSTQYILLRTSG